MYNAFIRLKVRKVIAEKDIPLQRAIDFLKENKKYGVVLDSVGNELKLEELKDAKDFGSNDSIESDNTDERGRTLSESSYREILGIIEDKAKPSSERDNKWD